MAKFKMVIAIFTLILTSAIYANTFSKADLPMIHSVLKKAYTDEQCAIDIPNAPEQTCNCLREAMIKNLNEENLFKCHRNIYDPCVGQEFAAAKSALTKDQIIACKSLAEDTASGTEADNKAQAEVANNKN